MIHNLIWNRHFVDCLNLLKFFDSSFGEVGQLLIVIVVEATEGSLVGERYLRISNDPVKLLRLN